MKKVIILGAGIYQVPLIKKAREMGYYVIVCSIQGNYPGFQFADKVYYENTTDKEKILQIALQEKISGILTTGTDVAVKTIGYVCEKMGLNGISQASAGWSTDKFLMKEKFAAGNVRTAPFYKVSNISEAEKAVDQLQFPVIFKCVDKSGSRGIIKVECVDDIEKAYEYSTSYTDRDYIIVEKFIEGYEIGLDGYINRSSNKKVLVPHGKIMYDNGYTKVPVGHIFPYECSLELKNDILEQAEKAIDSLELDNCFFNMDILINSDRSYIIEVGGRTGATGIPELMSCYLKCDYYEAMVNNAVGETVQITNEGFGACAGALLLSETSGKVSEIFVPEVKLKIYEQIQLDYSIGEFVNKFKVGPDRIGQIIVANNEVELAMERLEKIKNKIIIKTEA